jgi:hypothetical protein
MSKFLLLNTVAVIGIALAIPAHAETKLIMNSDTGVSTAIANNPKIMAQAETLVNERSTARNVTGNTTTVIGNETYTTDSPATTDSSSRGSVNSQNSRNDGAASDASGGVLVDSNMNTNIDTLLQQNSESRRDSIEDENQNTDRSLNTTTATDTTVNRSTNSTMDYGVGAAGNIRINR